MGRKCNLLGRRHLLNHDRPTLTHHLPHDGGADRVDAARPTGSACYMLQRTSVADDLQFVDGAMGSACYTLAVEWFSGENAVRWH
jgi:hypothetical protein